jgi:hypothetical protein
MEVIGHTQTPDNYSAEKKFPYALDEWLGGHQNLFDEVEEGKILCF